MSKKSYFLASVFRIILLCVLVLPMVVTTQSEVVQASRSAADPLWYVDPAWSYRKQITIDSSMVSDDLVDFPVLVYLNSDADLASGALPNGDDILFTDSNDVKLSHEIEYYNAGDLVAWVNVPILSSSVDTTLYIYYGNGSAPNQEDPGGVWDSNYVFVQHLEETTGTHYDSTTNANNGTPQSGLIQNAAGKIDGADEFPGTDEFIDLGAPTSLDVFGPNQDFSIFLWVKRDGISDVEGFFASGSNGDNGIYFGSSFQNTDDLRFYSRANTVLLESTSSAIGDTEWHLVGLTADRDGLMHFWVDGASVTSASIASTAGQNWNNGDDTYKIGTDRSESNPCDGLIDEVRLSDIVRDPDWIATEYNNQSDPASFFVLGPQQTVDEPSIIDELPSDGSIGVEITLNQLSFHISDPQGGLLDYTVTTNPHIGSGTGTDVTAGTYTVDISGLNYDTTYEWNFLT